MIRCIGVCAGVLAVLVLIAPTAFAVTGRDGTDTALSQSLFDALRRDDISLLASLRDKGADLDSTLYEAGMDAESTFDGLVGISELLRTNADLEHWPLLTWAVYLQREDFIRVLIKSGAVVNATDTVGTRPLHWAAWTGNYPITKMLLENGASPYVRDRWGRTPLDWALKTNQPDIVRLLPRAKIYDTDCDGVPDHLDRCPGTPIGASVDERGCWIAAYANFFDFDRAVVKKQYLPHLQRQAEVLNANPHLIVELVGHTDSVGSNAYNMDLGMRRSLAVKQILVNYGVDAARLKTSSRGEEEPIATNRYSAGRAKNRRVEIRIWEEDTGVQ